MPESFSVYSGGSPSRGNARSQILLRPSTQPSTVTRPGAPGSAGGKEQAAATPATTRPMASMRPTTREVLRNIGTCLGPWGGPLGTQYRPAAPPLEQGPEPAPEQRGERA